MFAFTPNRVSNFLQVVRLVKIFIVARFWNAGLQTYVFVIRKVNAGAV